MHRRGLALVAALMMVGCDEEKGGDARVDDILALTGDPAAGEAVYTTNCEECHRASGMGVDDPVDPGIGENFAEVDEEDEELVPVILYGEGEMPAFEDILTDQEIADVLAYVRTTFMDGGAPTTPTPVE